MIERLRTHFLVLGSYVVITLVMTLPVGLHLTTSLAGSGGDPWQTLWRFEEKGEMLTEAWQKLGWRGVGELFQAEFFGGGEARLNNLSVWPWLPLHLWFGEPFTYNIVWLLSFILGGYGMFLLLDRLVGPISSFLSSAWLAGLFYMFLPYHVAHALGHFGAMQIQWLPFLFFLLISLFQQPRWWKALLFILLVTLQGWTEHHYMLWFAVAALLYLIVRWREVRRLVSANFSVVGMAIVIVIGVGFLVGGAYWPTWQLNRIEPSSVALGEEQAIRFSADVFSFVVPAIFHPWWGGLSGWLFGQYFTGNIAEATHFLGIFPLLVVVFFHNRVLKRQLIFWVTLAAVFFIIALGPRLHVLGHVLPIPLPYSFIESIFPFSAVRAVARASVMVGVAMAVLFGLVIHYHVRRRAVIALCGGLVLLEFLSFPIPGQATQLSPVYSAIAKLPGTTLIEIPAATNYVLASRALYASHFHGKDVIGNVALERGARQNEREDARSLPALRQLLYLRSHHLEKDRSEFFGQDMVETLSDVLRYLDTGEILLHTDSVSVAQAHEVREFLEHEAQLTFQEFGDSLLYETGTLRKGDGVFVRRGDGWITVQYEEESDRYVTTLNDRALIQVMNIDNVTKQAQLVFTLIGEVHVIRGDSTTFFSSGSHRISLELLPGATEVVFAGKAELFDSHIELE